MLNYIFDTIKYCIKECQKSPEVLCMLYFVCWKQNGCVFCNVWNLVPRFWVLAAAHCTPVNLNVVSHKDTVIMSFNHSSVILAIYRVLEVVEIRKFWCTTFIESNLVNKPLTCNYICIIYYLVIGCKGNIQTV